MAGSQIFLSIEATVIIFGWDKLPLPLIGFFVTVFISSTVVAFMYAKWAAKLGQTSQQLIFNCCQKLEARKGMEKGWKVLLKVWESKDKIRMYYGDGSTLEFQRSSPALFLFVLLNNITTLLLLLFT